MRSRGGYGYAVALSVVAALTTWAALTSWRGFLVGPLDYLGPLLVLGLLLAFSGSGLRWLGTPAVVTTLVQAAIAAVFVCSHLGGGPLPIGAAGEEMFAAIRQAVESARSYRAPIGADAPPVAPLLVIGGAVFLVLVDLIACTMRRVPIAGLALLAVYSVPAGLVESGPGWLSFVLAAAGFLVLLQLDGRERLARWGRPLGADEHNPWQETSPVAGVLRTGAGRIGVTATALAVIAAPLVPVLDLDLLGIGPGSGNDDIRIHNPRADLRRDLERDEDIPLLRFTTDDPSPDHLRVAVLNRFSGLEWSSGDRAVADANTATGELPDPTGLSPDVPRRTYHYQVDVSDELDSSWLPTQFPASSVTADGDWRYDEDTMDFLAVPDDLTTAGVSYRMTGLEPDYGLDGRFFHDSAPDAVDDEFLEVPGGLPSEVRNYASSVTAGASDDYERALLLQDWFRESGGFRYSLERAPEGTGGDAFSTFLNPGPGGRVGYCEQFASAMAVMARIVGIPARVAVGFLQPSPLGGGAWEYSSHDLHAWTELYFDDAGWVMFEPTPARISGTAPGYSTVPVEQPDSQPTGGATDQGPSDDLTQRPNDATDTAATQPDAGAEGAAGGNDGGDLWSTILVVTLVVLLVLAVLVLAAFAPRTLRERVRTRRLTGGPDDHWDEIRATAVDLGLPWPAGRSPREIAGRMVDHLGARGGVPAERPRTGRDVDPDAAAALDRIVSAVELTRYGRPGAASPLPDLTEDTRACCDSLVAGVTPGALRRSRWLPRSLWQTPSPTPAERPVPAGR